MNIAEYLEARSMPEPNSGCVLWTKSVTKHGYGHAWDGKKHWRAHRLSWTLAKGPIPDGQNVCHTCDVPSCINPHHLWLGTDADNHADRDAKGRESKGKRHAASMAKSQKWLGAVAKLTAQQVRQIRADPRTHRRIAADHGTDHRTVGRIKRGEAWQRVI